jgi:putative ABC transport system permease protein
MTANLRGRITHVNGVPADKALVDRTEEWVTRSDRGFTYTDTQPPHSTLTEGQWWPADYNGPAIVSISTDVARAFDIGVGAELTVNIFGRAMTAKVYNVRDVDWASFAMNFAVTFAPGDISRVPATFLATVTVDAESESALQSKLAAALPNVTVIRVREALDIARGLVMTVSSAVRYGAALTLVMAAGLAVVLGTGAGYAILHFILDLPWAFFPKTALVTGAACLALTLLAGFAGTWRALSQSAARHLRSI